MDYLRKFRDLVPPPHKPIACNGNWAQAEADLHTRLPPDYKQFVEEYGSGIFLNFLWIFTPFAKSQQKRLGSMVDEIFEGYKIATQSDNELMPYALFPEKGGLLPFSQSDNGDELCWITNGAPSNWHVVWVGIQSQKFYEYKNYAMVDFLCALITGDLKCPLIPAEFLKADPRFARKGKY